MKSDKTTKALRVGTNTLLIFLIIGAITMFFDDDYRNDHLGWIILIAFWMFSSLYGLVICIKEGMKKLAIVNLLLVTAAFYFLLTRSMEYFN